jgi:uncharacterized metal-binding protein
MASGKNHDRSILFASPVVAIVVGSHSLELGIVAASAHLLGGLYLSPDLDLLSKPYKRWGWLRWIWIPYQKLIPCHRHWLSHGVIVGSIVRLLYLAAVVFASRSTASGVGYHLGKGDRVFGWSRAKRIESPVVGWLAVALASECKGTVEGKPRLDRVVYTIAMSC